MLTISKSKLKAQMLQLLRELEANGEEIIVTDRDRPIARITPYTEAKPTVEELFADWQGQVIFYEDPNTPTVDEWEDLE